MSNTSHLKTIGIVGLGIMGRGMADNFLQKGHTVFVWNRTTSATNTLKSKGATVCETPAEVAQQAEVIFEVTANDESSRSVWLGEQGILAGADASKVLVASATLSVKWIDELIAHCQKSNFHFFDMALTGGRVGAETGALTLLCGGDESELRSLEPTLLSIAKQVKHFGPVGSGMRYKLILNFLQAVHIVGFGQAMKLAKALGMETQKVGDALAERPGGVITGLSWQGYQQEPDPINFSIEWITKDLSYAKAMAGEVDVEMLDQVLAKYTQAVAAGYAGKDWTRVVVEGACLG